MKKSLKILLISTGMLLCFSLLLYGYSTLYINSSSGMLKEEVIIEIDPGTSFYKTAHLLEDKGVIDNVRKFYIYARLRGHLSDIKAGEYLISPSMTMAELLDELVRGNVIKHRVTIPEGFNLYQIADLLDKREIVKKEAFLHKATDKIFASQIGIEGKTLEGYLYPETYFFVKGMNSEEIIRRMAGRLQTVFTDEDKKRAEELGFTMHEIVNLASVIEKETGDPSERPIISAVFHNRLKKKMRLQSDPTVIYGMISSFDGDLRKKDLRKKTPYNTYRINGLPAGPIANPGKEAIKAALYPADADYIYFVSMNNGRHVFAKTLKEHNRNVWKYQKRRKR